MECGYKIRFVSVFTGEPVMLSNMVMELHKYRLNKDDFEVNHQALLHRSRATIIKRLGCIGEKDTCPECNTRVGAMVYGSFQFDVTTQHKELRRYYNYTIYFLCKCLKCRKLFLVERKYITKNIDKNVMITGLQME